MNNQHRLLTKSCQPTDTQELRATFQNNLHRIGKVVAILDDFQKPLYLTRVWTIFEQYTALSLGLPVEMILPPKADELLISEVKTGDVGLDNITRSLMKVDVENSKATMKHDEDAVKKLIREGAGFHSVNSAVQASLVLWAAARFRAYMLGRVEELSAAQQALAGTRMLCLGATYASITSTLVSVERRCTQQSLVPSAHRTDADHGQDCASSAATIVTASSLHSMDSSIAP